MSLMAPKSNTSKPINSTFAWKKLQLHAFTAGKRMNLRNEFSRDTLRTRDLSISGRYMHFDYSRQLVNRKTVKLLLELAERSGLRNKINDMRQGKKMNITENRAVLHTKLRDLSFDPLKIDGEDVAAKVKVVLNKIRIFSDEIASGKRVGVTGKKVKNIVAIGIGGSYLGPEYLAEACRAYAKDGMTLKFVANVDGTDFVQKTGGLNPEETLFVIISKTFTTAETIKNANTAKKWMTDKLGNSPDVISKHFIAVSTAKELVKKFGIDPGNMFEFWDWVGGRFSATSAVGGVPLSLFLGYDKFEEILKGANWMDLHFFYSPFDRNIPVMAGLLDIYNINFLGIKVRALLPYSQALGRLPAHTQQVEMESNGKSIDVHGRNVPYSTGEVVFGEPGTNGQHSFYQLLHQGNLPVSCDFIGITDPQYKVGVTSEKEVDHHKELYTNFIAQPDALAFGKTAAEVIDEMIAASKPASDAFMKTVLPHKIFEGNRPSSSILLKELTPFTAGALLAFTEHRAAVKGFIWGINSFDQFGVELGKVLGTDIRNRILLYIKDPNDAKVFADLNPSSAWMLTVLLKEDLHK